MEEEYGRFFLSNFRAAPLHFGPEEEVLEVVAEVTEVIPEEEEVVENATKDDREVDKDVETEEHKEPQPLLDPQHDQEVQNEDFRPKDEPRGSPRFELPPLPPEPAQPGPSGQGNHGNVDLEELERRLQDLARPSSRSSSPVKGEKSPKELRFSDVEVVEPKDSSGGGDDFPVLPHAVAAAAAATVTQDLADRGAETRVQDAFSERNRSPSRRAAQRQQIEIGKLPGASGAPEMPNISIMEMDEEVARNIDAFFAKEQAWQELSQSCNLQNGELIRRIQQLPVVSSATKYKVTVPKPYPGVQYRRSKNLEERYSRFAENGAIVAGQLEADSTNGQWLRISGNIFLPVRVGQIHILDEVVDAPESDGKESKSDSWWACCPSNASQKAAEVASQGKALEQVAQPMRSAEIPQ